MSPTGGPRIRAAFVLSLYNTNKNITTMSTEFDTLAALTEGLVQMEEDDDYDSYDEEDEETGPGTAIVKASHPFGGGASPLAIAEAEVIQTVQRERPVQAVDPVVAGRLHCPVCASEDVAVLPQGVVDTAIVCKECGSSFLVPILAAARETYEMPTTAPPPPSTGGEAGEAGESAGGSEAAPEGSPLGGSHPERGYSDASNPDATAEAGSVTEAMKAAAGGPKQRKRPSATRADLVAKSESRGYPAYAGPLYADDEKTETFYRRIGSIMTDNMYDRKVGGKRSGELHTRSLYKVPVGSSRVFQRREERNNKKYNVVLLVDTSGSMGDAVRDAKGHRIEYTPDQDYNRFHMVADLTRMLVAGLSRYNVNFSVVTFGGNSSGIAPIVLKKFGDAADPEQLHWDIVNSYYITDRGGNFDYAGVMAAQTLLQDKAEEQNIVMILCDGGVYTAGFLVKNPLKGTIHDACDGTLAIGVNSVGRPTSYSEDGPCLKQAATELNRLAKVITIGINTREVLDWYPNAHPVNDYDEFMQTTLRELQRCIIRG